jgi:hypothetical protein
MVTELMGVYLMSVHIMGAHLICRCLIGVYLMSVSYKPIPYERASHCVYFTGRVPHGRAPHYVYLMGVYLMSTHHGMQPVYLVVRTHLRLLVVAGLVSHFSFWH